MYVFSCLIAHINKNAVALTSIRTSKHSTKRSSLYKNSLIVLSNHAAEEVGTLLLHTSYEKKTTRTIVIFSPSTRIERLHIKNIEP